MYGYMQGSCYIRIKGICIYKYIQYCVMMEYVCIHIHTYTYTSIWGEFSCTHGIILRGMGGIEAWAKYGSNAMWHKERGINCLQEKKLLFLPWCTLSSSSSSLSFSLFPSPLPSLHKAGGNPQARPEWRDPPCVFSLTFSLLRSAEYWLQKILSSKLWV